jgi:hypothetical protein
MTTTPTVIATESPTAHSIDALKFSHRWILKRNDFFEEQWLNKMFDHGYRFASYFAAMFPGRENMIEQMLLQAAPEPGQEHNWFWSWWKTKWMQDDWQYITDKVHLQPISYDQYKSYMLNCEMLEQDLLDLLTLKQQAA